MTIETKYWETQLLQPKAILELKDIHKGERAFIIGNGPSLKEEPTEALEALNDELTFTCNRLPLWEQVLARRLEELRLLKERQRIGGNAPKMRPRRPIG